MTLLTPAPAMPALRLAEAEPGFWVANLDGAFAGTIDRHGEHFYVRDCFGRYLGDYPALSTARAHLRQTLARRTAA